MTLRVSESVTEYRPDSAGELRPSSRRDTKRDVSIQDTTKSTGASRAERNESGTSDIQQRAITESKTDLASPNLYIIGGLILSILLNVWLIGRSIK